MYVIKNFSGANGYNVDCTKWLTNLAPRRCTVIPKQEMNGMTRNDAHI